MALHGHTKIELQDVETGEKKIVEDDNMVTNGLAKMLVPALGFANIFNTYSFYTESDVNRAMLVNRFLGGIICFEQQQEENADNFIRDASNKIIAKGSNYAYSGKDNVQGSYNLDESGLQENGTYKKVWDFSTNQGNGTIASLSLTTCFGGEFGDGSNSLDTESKWSTEILHRLCAKGNYTQDDYSIVPNISHNSVLINGAFDLLCYADYINNMILFIKDYYSIRYDADKKDSYFYNTQKLVLKKLNVPFSKVSVICDPLNFSFDREDIEITIPDSILTQCSSANNFVSMQYDEGFMYFIMCKLNTYINPGNSLKVLRIKVVDFSAEVISITNTSPEPFYFYGYTIGSSPWYGDRVGYYAGSFNINNRFFSFISCGNGGNRKIYRINMEDNTDVSEYKKEDGSEFISIKDKMISLLKIDDMLYCGDGKTILNMNTCIAKNTKNINGRQVDLYNSSFYYLFEAMGKSAVYYIGKSNSYNLYFYPCFKQDTLMTINNLPEPVTKTASQTMKITYTLEET